MLVLLVQVIVYSALPGQTLDDYARHPSKEIYDAAVVAMEARKFEDANTYFSKAILALDSTKKLDYNMLWQSLVFRGICRKELNDLQGSLADFNRAILYYPEVIQTHLRRGSVLIALGELNEAEAESAWVLSRDQSSSHAASAHYQLGLIYLERADPKQAISEFSKVLKILPRSIETLSKRAVAFSAIGAHKAAINDFSRIININPQYGIAYRDRALEKVKLAQKSSSRRILHSACKDFEDAIRLGDREAIEHCKQNCQN